MRDESGFTLVEVLIASMILVWFFGAAFSVLGTGVDTYFRGEDKADRQQNARIALDRLIREVRQSDEIISVSNGGRVVNFIDYKGRNIRYVYDATKQELLRQVLNNAGVVQGSNAVGYGITELRLESVPAAVYIEGLSVTITSGNYSTSSYIRIRSRAL